MNTITAKDGTQIYYKDWGRGPVVTFSHGWPLNADAWDGQMCFLAERAKFSQGTLDQFWLWSMQAGLKNAYDSIKAFSETDFTEDLKKFDIPTLVMHGEDDQIVPVKDSAKKSSKLIKGVVEIYYPGLPHGLTATHADLVNRDLLAFCQQDQRQRKVA